MPLRDASDAEPALNGPAAPGACPGWPQVTQHAECEARLAVLPETDDPGGGHKVKLLSVLLQEDSAAVGGLGVDIVDDAQSSAQFAGGHGA